MGSRALPFVMAAFTCWLITACGHTESAPASSASSAGKTILVKGDANDDATAGVLSAPRKLRVELGAINRAQSAFAPGTVLTLSFAGDSGAQELRWTVVGNHFDVAGMALGNKKVLMAFLDEPGHERRMITSPVFRQSDADTAVLSLMF